ncbi:thioredoxin family protein [Paenibacillus hubeiensis]|uniref:thioredoxin family protein n=1 Tax=Paenibacillus hubeiensis TaxID=3077330 RepID=UPI0031BB0E39
MGHVLELGSIGEVHEFVQNHRLSILYVTQEDCSVCHAIYPKLLKLNDEFPEAKLGRVDAGKVKEVAGEFLIFSAPAISVFLDGKEYIREGRFVQFDDLTSRLELLSSTE